jgi:antitoxin component YwqK of YwqJK toxin-antitoxin module
MVAPAHTRRGAAFALAVVGAAVACSGSARVDAPVAVSSGPADAGAGPSASRTFDPEDRTTWTADQVRLAAVKLDSITCPAGTVLVGQAPPLGYYAYCELPTGERHGPWMTWPPGYQRKLAIEDHGHTVLWTAWHASNDALEIVMELRDDERHGRELRWHDNGALAADGTWAHGRPAGRFQAWGRDGVPIFDAELDGTGRLVTWDGALRVEEHWRDGRRHGDRTTWYASGQVERVTVFVEGEPRSVDAWHPNGRKAQEVRYGRDGGGADATVIEWDEQGREEPRMCAHGPCDMPPE